MAFLKYFSDFDLNSKNPIFFKGIVQNLIHFQKIVNFLGVKN